MGVRGSQVGSVFVTSPHHDPVVPDSLLHHQTQVLDPGEHAGAIRIRIWQHSKLVGLGGAPTCSTWILICPKICLI